MEKPWFNLDPNNSRDRWWLYSSIKNINTAKNDKNDNNILCELIIQDINSLGTIFWRRSTWYKDDPNRYLNNIYDNEWPYSKILVDMEKGDIITKYGIKFKVHNCEYAFPDQSDFIKILERIEE